MTPHRSALTLILLFAALASVLSACETAPPVQEMSDARQAIAVAREAGATDLAAVELLEAERYLERAEQSLSRREYHDAREAATEARERARNALRMTEGDRDKRF